MSPRPTVGRNQKLDYCYWREDCSAVLQSRFHKTVFALRLILILTHVRIWQVRSIGLTLTDPSDSYKEIRRRRVLEIIYANRSD